MSSFDESVGEVSELTIKEADIPFSELQRRDEEIGWHSGGAIIIFKFRGERKVLLIQRVDSGSWGGSWEMPCGSYDNSDDRTIVDTAIREAEEESSVKLTREDISKTVYRDTFYHWSGTKNATYYMIVNQELELNTFPEVRLRDDEHSDYRFFTKEEIEGFSTRTEEEFRNTKPEIQRAMKAGQMFMLPRKKEAVLKAFEASSQAEGRLSRRAFWTLFSLSITFGFIVGRFPHWIITPLSLLFGHAMARLGRVWRS